MIVPFLSSCASGNGVSVVDMGGWKAEYSLSASDSLPGVAGNPADIMVLDSLLLVRDGEQLVICNTDSRESRTLFGRGRGPGEMLGFYDFSYDAASREPAMLDVSSQSILSACIDSLLSDDYLSGSVRRSQLLDVPMLFLQDSSSPQSPVRQKLTWNHYRVSLICPSMVRNMIQKA